MSVDPEAAAALIRIAAAFEQDAMDLPKEPE
jgi:hypothetical protein